MKAQISYTTKPLVLVFMVILIVFLLYSFSTAGGEEKAAQKRLDLLAASTNILLVLANSQDCLAYEETSLEETYANIVDIQKLDDFALRYQKIEPECARHHDYGFIVRVIEILDEQGTVGDQWSFGAEEFSFGRALTNKFGLWIPIAIRRGEQEINVGKMEIELYDGQLERVAGFLDWSCMMGKLDRSSRNFANAEVRYPISINQSGSICIVSGGRRACRQLLCKISQPVGISRPGTYMFRTDFQSPDTLGVSI